MGATSSGFRSYPCGRRLECAPCDASPSPSSWSRRQRDKNLINADLRLLLETIARACKAISTRVNKGALADGHGCAGTRERAGRGAEEARRPLQRDPARGQRVGRQPGRARLRGDGESEPDPDALPARRVPAAVRPARRLVQHRRQHLGRHHLLGAECPKLADGKYCEPDEKAFLQPGSSQVAAGFAVYGPTTVFVLTVGDGAHGFTLDRETYTFVLTHPDIRIPRRHAGVRHQRVEPAALGAAGAGATSTSAWPARTARAARTSTCAGWPRWWPTCSACCRAAASSCTRATPKNKEGRLRLMYEANPMAFIVEQAGGAATDGKHAASSTSSPRGCTSASRWSSARRTRSSRSPRTTSKRGKPRSGKQKGRARRPAFSCMLPGNSVTSGAC